MKSVIFLSSILCLLFSAQLFAIDCKYLKRGYASKAVSKINNGNRLQLRNYSKASGPSDLVTISVRGKASVRGNSVYFKGEVESDRGTERVSDMILDINEIVVNGRRLLKVLPRDKAMKKAVRDYGELGIYSICKNFEKYH